MTIRHLVDCDHKECNRAEIFTPILSVVAKLKKEGWFIDFDTEGARTKHYCPDHIPEE